MVEMLKNSPAGSHGSTQRLQELYVFSVKILRQAQGKHMSHVEGRRPFFRMCASEGSEEWVWENSSEPPVMNPQ